MALHVGPGEATTPLVAVRTGVVQAVGGAAMKTTWHAKLLGVRAVDAGPGQVAGVMKRRPAVLSGVL
ncbi:hypothetical protein [Streptomyces virginiae]|uniref:Uncharacterized protein n=1 Tax=Streptomyces virginiae TaxID=1961 RepID=A0ABZ1TNQ1_STRVG|nr:hypothetical protein [Streptomyces virginiae]WTB26141.1 hypothetical protein OG253_34290 [Streptomyces virginiae]